MHLHSIFDIGQWQMIKKSTRNRAISGCFRPWYVPQASRNRLFMIFSGGQVRHWFLAASSQLNQGSQGFAKLKQMLKYRAANLKIRGKHISYPEELRDGMEQAMPTLVWVIMEMERVRCLLLKNCSSSFSRRWSWWAGSGDLPWYRTCYYCQRCGSTPAKVGKIKLYFHSLHSRQ